MDNVVDNCGLLISHMGITIKRMRVNVTTLWITVDDMWIKKGALIRENIKLSLFHRPTTVINFLISYRYIGGTK